MTRSAILSQLEEQFNNDFANNGYKPEFKPDGTMTQCNFGGILVIVGNSGDSVIVWSDWSDEAISHELTECEIEYQINEEGDEDEEGYKPLIHGFTFQDTFYSLDDFMRID